MTSVKKIKILYVIGSGRSGSTVISTVLGNDKSIVNAGEVYNYKWFFDSAIQNNRKCSCQSDLLSCRYWDEVRKLTKSSIGDDLPDLKIRNKKQFIKNNLAVFQSICKVSKKHILLDSSKRVYRLSLLEKSDEIELVILHLVRDVRAYAYSSFKTEIKKGASNLVYFKKASSWFIKNLFVYIKNFHKPNYLLIRYEDFVLNPDRNLSKIYDKLKIESSIMDDLLNSKQSESHQFSGNSRVFDQSNINLKLDTRYLSEVSNLYWAISTLISFPALKLFGYKLSRCNP